MAIKELEEEHDKEARKTARHKRSNDRILDWRQKTNKSNNQKPKLII